jgi:DNA polymerase-1
MLLDGHSLAYRAFYALPVENFSTVDGRFTNAVYGFVSMLLNTLRDEQPTHVAVAFDVSRSTFRSAEFPEYKANRSTSPREFGPQVDILKDVLAAFRIPTFAVENYEADDIIATLARQAAADDFEVLILTGDRDAFQLVNESITVLYPKKGVSELARMTPAAVEDKYGIRPDQYADFAALRGDPSDNLPGIPGVGEKTAAKWIQQYGSVGALADHVDQVKGKVGDALREHIAAVLLNRRLTELVDAVPLEVGLEALRRQDADRSEVDVLFDELEFRALRDRLPVVLGAGGGDDAAAGESGAIDGDGDRLEAGALTTWLEAVAETDPVAMAIEGDHDDALLGLAAGDRAASVPLASLTDDDRIALAREWHDRARLVVHDLNRFALRLCAAGVAPPQSVRMDVQLAAYLMAPDARGYELDLLARTRLGHDLTDAGDSGDLALFATDDGAADAAVRSAARATLALVPLFEVDLERNGATALLCELEQPLTAVIVAMEQRGIAVDVDGLRTLGQSFDADALAAVEVAQGLVGHPVNLASPKQLQVVLFDELDMPKTRKTKTGYTTDAESLQTLFEQTEHPFLAQVLLHREAAKLRSTVDGLLAAVQDDSRIRTTLRQTIAATGRLSSTEPNLQNIPIRTAAGRRIREGFVVGDGYECLLTADYSQIEMRIMAHLSGDEGLIAAFRSGEDLHTTAAAQVFEVAPEAVDAEMRRRIKAMSYGLAYGLSPFGLAKQLGTSNDEARVLMDAYFERFGGVRDYLRSVVDEARSTGYTETILGRRRYLPDLLSDNRVRREAAERMALNSPIQGSAADIIKKAMLEVERAVREAGLRSRLLLQIHDELLFEVGPGERDELEQIVRAAMGGAYPLLVPLDVSVGVGANWDAAGH